MIKEIAGSIAETALDTTATVAKGLADIVNRNVLSYKGDAEKLSRHATCAWLGFGLSYLVEYLGPDSNAIFRAANFAAEYGLFAYGCVKTWETIKDIGDYLF